MSLKIKSGSKYRLHNKEDFFNSVMKEFEASGVSDDELDFFNKNEIFKVHIMREPLEAAKNSPNALYGISFVGENQEVYNNDYKVVNLDFFVPYMPFVHEEFEI